MTELTLAERVTVLEHQMAELRAVVEKLTQPKDWRSTIGMFSGDEVMKQIFDEALKFREKDRERARRQYARSRQSKR
jgi:hypothetical protein